MDNNNNNFSTPKQPTINSTTGGQLRSRSNSSPSTSSISTPRNGSTTATTSSITNSIGKGSLVFSTMENAKKTLNMDSLSTPMSQSSKKRLSMNSSLLPPSSIPLPPSQQLSAKKDPSKRHSSFISTTTTTSLGSRPSTPQPNHTTNNNNNNNNGSNGNNVTSTNISSMLESNNSEILSQNQKVTLSTSSNTAFSSLPSSTNNGNNPLSNSGGGNGNHHLVNSNSSTSTPSPTMFISTTSPPPELSLMEGFNQHNLTTTTTTTTTTTNNTLNTSNGINSNSLSPSSHLNNGSNNNNNNNHLNLNNRSSSPSPTPSSSSISGRRTPIQNFNSVGGVNITSKTQPLFSDREESIQAVCRFRPETAAEQTLGPSEKQLTIGTDQTTIHITPTSSSSSSMAQAFRFSKVYQPNTTQESFYNEVGKPLIDNIVNGYNVGIIAYGQTGAGKTFSLGFSGGEGNDSYNSYCNRSEFYNNSHYLYGSQQQQQQQQLLPSSWGIMPRIIKDLFIKQDEQQSMNTPQRIKFTTKISYLEVYKEKVYDLLSEGGVNDIEIRMADGGFIVPDAVQSSIQTFTDFLTHLQHIEKNRKIAETKKNMASSRSHAIFIVSLLKEDLENKMTVTSLLYLVDLAGSESASKIDGTTSKIEETKSINKSLYALGGVIEDMSKNSKHVRYRDSKLTQLLQQCFGGNSKTCLIVNCSSSNHESVIRETIQSLNFGQRAQSVKNKPLQNVEESHSELKAKLRELNKDIETYKKFIEKISINSGVIPPSSVATYITQLQNACEELKKKNDRLQEDIINLEEENSDLPKKFNVLNKNNVSQIEILTQELELSKQINQEQLLKIEQYSQKYQATNEEIQKSFNHRQQLVNDLHDSNEKSKQLELKLKDALLNSKSESDEIRLKLTKALEESTDKDQRINTLESNKQKWKSKCNEVVRQSKELQDRLNILQSTYSNSVDSLSNSSLNNNNNESLEEIKKLKLNISSLTNQHIEREKSLQKEIDLARSKHTEQTLILKNLKTQIDTLTNKLEIQFPTIVNNNQQQQQSTQSSSSSSIESNLIISMNTIEVLFEKICKNQEQTNTIISTNVESIMGKLVEIDENEEFIRKEKDRERERAENLKNTLEDAQSNFLKQQEEIKQFIETQLKNKNNINNNNNIKNNNNNNKLKSKKVGSSSSSSSNIGSSICINILFFLIILVILFFLMVAVGLTIQNQDYNSQYRSSYFFKTT
ncbi:kinesin family member 9 [Dictyostelium discoideum AX4]|uniref:Kinesin-related protein 9 n=1 Tax=Dictyostelium discoideum TaxID=44689 RepID=KIF9_DICDI|nr:kinesin family member 9 [Dictyostelium discoideum AX4]Q555I8.1 RecName: Full=Kinesin-related protein 9; AltName: Full=Kinesin family member 9 [Dictyostelium discoideum]EAL70194.1 kinesin family member 9 [Dictyostelium discoideum AX4]|eukprot:XP_644079.1 kinesin family member 9 [Dictyostelium discoideum AX4]